MTITKDSSLLCSFKLKIDEAISYVPKMPATEKVKAVQFWNLISEKLQDIVNSNSAAINAAAAKNSKNELEKIPVDVTNSRSVNTSNCNISSDFINLSSNYNLTNELIEQYHSVDISNSQLLNSETFSIVTESSLNSIASISQLNSQNNSMNSCDASIANNYIAIECLPENNCDTFTSSLAPIRTGDYILKEISSQESNHNYDTSEDPGEISENSCSGNNSTLISTQDEEEFVEVENRNISILKKTLKEKNCIEFQSELSSDNPENNDSEDCDTFNDSVRSEYEAVGDSSSGSTKQTDSIVCFVVSSSSEEIVAKNAFKPEVSDVDKRCSCVEGKCSHVKSYMCSDCPAKFATKGNLMVHMRRHTGEKPYSCSKCSSSFTTKGNLVRHLKTHTGEKPFQCSHCGSKFTEKKSLKIHIRRHTGERPYECKVCGKKFAQSGILRTHMSMHLNQKFHLCEHCGKSFRQKSQLHIHNLRHQNIKKHGCPLCTSRFLTKGDLERHMRIHTGERPFSCELCTRTFTRQQALNEHINRHYGLRPYACKYCGRSFSEMSGCYKHTKQHEKSTLDETVGTSTEPSTIPDDPSFPTTSASVEIIRLTKANISRQESISENEDNDIEQAVEATYIENFIE